MTSTDIIQNTDVTTFKNFTKYPKVIKGDSNYQTMGISCLIGGINDSTQKYEDDIELLKAWQDFVVNSGLCLWKDRKGSIKLGTITENPSMKYMDETSEQITSISFNFVETGDVSEIAVANSEIENEELCYIDVKTKIGQNITIYGLDKKLATSEITRFTCKTNTLYTISVDEATGYTKPTNKTITTGDANSVLTVLMEYEPL